MIRSGAITLTLAALLATGGCTLAPDPTTIQLLDPRPDSGTAPAGEPAPWSLNVSRPETDPTRDSNRVLVRTREGQLQVHPSARWVAPAPDLVRTLMLRYFRDRELVSQAGAAAMASDRTLAIDLRQFELAERGTGLVAEITAEARLYDSTSGDLLGRRLLEAERELASSRPDEITAGFEAALAELLPRLGDWLIEQGSK